MYDAATKSQNYLREYAREFASVEVDSTFYGTPAPERLLRWAQSVPAHFTFALKLPREITHERRLIGCEKPIAEFFASADALGPQLEAVLVQMGPDFTPDDRASLEAFVPMLPAGPRIAIEMRDPRWFEGRPRNELFALLREHNIALAVTDGTFVDLELMLDAFARPTASFGYIRWLGRRDAVSRFDRVVIDRAAQIGRWAAAIRAAASTLERVSAYANNHYAGHSPQTVRAIMEALGVPHVRPARVIQDTLF
ncbi:MAG: DUF72 domain-containing protein [Candidatus Velthaea sp.]